MCFLSFPTEIRLGIYPELLVQDSLIEFGAAYGRENPPLIRLGRRDLYPAILGVNKTVNKEATPLLYSNNHFRFADASTSSDLTSDSKWYNYSAPYIAPFLRQIGLNTYLLRHITVDFPTSFTSWNKPVLHKGYSQILQLIRETCTDLRTVEMSCSPPDGILSLSDINRAAEMLRELDNGGFGAISSLERIVVVLGEYEIDEQDMADCESLVQMMPSSKWCIKLIKVPPRIWISDDDRVEFDNYEDLCEYNDELHRVETKREEQREQEEWEEEYWRRRHDPCWKNDSDYD